MNLTFQGSYFIAFTLLLVMEVGIAIYIKLSFIRHTVGDFLVVILIYCCFRSFVKTKPIKIAIITFLISYTIEFLQLFKILQYLNLQHNKWAILILGNSFSIQDLIAYTLGIGLIWHIDSYTTRD